MKTLLNKNNTNKRDISYTLLVISISLMPYTALKWGSIGPSEMLILLVFFLELYKHHFRIKLFSTDVSKLYAIFFMLAFLGMIFNLVRIPLFHASLSSTRSSIRFDMYAYIFVLLTMETVELYSDRCDETHDIEKLLYEVLIINCVVMPFLFVLSRFRRNIFGLPLLYYSYFSPFATNIHHTSMYLLPLVFAALYFAENKIWSIKRLILYGYALFFSYLVLSTGASKGVMGVVAGGIVCIIFKLSSPHGQLTKSTKNLIGLLLFLVIVVFLINYSTIIRIAQAYFVDNDLHGERSKIWSTGLKHWLESPVIGFGYGAHVFHSGRYVDAHNSFLTAMLQAGGLGIIIFFSLWIKVFSNTKFNGFLLAMNVALLPYVAGGDTLRRIPCWVFILFSYMICNFKSSSIQSIRRKEYAINNY